MHLVLALLQVNGASSLLIVPLELIMLIYSYGHWSATVHLLHRHADIKQPALLHCLGEIQDAWFLTRNYVLIWEVSMCFIFKREDIFSKTKWKSSYVESTTVWQIKHLPESQEWNLVVKEKCCSRKLLGKERRISLSLWIMASRMGRKIFEMFYL